MFALFQSQVVKNVKKTILIDACCQTSDVESRRGGSAARKISSRSSSNERRRRFHSDQMSRRSRSEGRLLKVGKITRKRERN